MAHRKTYRTDASHGERAFAATYPTLMVEQTPQREHDHRVMFNALRWMHDTL